MQWFPPFFQIAFLGALKGELDETEIKHEFKGTGDFSDAKINLSGELILIASCIFLFILLTFNWYLLK